MISLFSKGKFEPINFTFIAESITQIQGLAQIQYKYEKGDMDTLLNELHDSIVGNYLGFTLINTEKHGFDCKLNEGDDIFLESKVASYSSSSWSATFNDTTLEKADAFRSKNVWLALSIWESVTSLLCICFGQNDKIGDFLEAGVNKHKNGEVTRSTQSISMNKLIFDYNFKILSPSLTPSELLLRLNIRRSLKQLDQNRIIMYKDFTNITDAFYK